jgi:hypothetical protein
MASIKIQRVVGDSGSQEFVQLLGSYNALLDVLGTLITGLKTTADEAATNALATTAETALQNTVYKVQGTYDIPNGPRMELSSR